VISEDELAAITAALTMPHPSDEPRTPERSSRWKLAAREPDFEIEDYRVR
jgi:hypothetical protein